MTFRSYYATRLYQYLKADYDANKRNKEEWTFTCEEIRDLFQVGKKQYSRPYNLIQKTIKPALEEIGASDYAYVWDYNEHRANTRGRPLESVSFKAVFFNDTGKGMTKEWYLTKGKPMEDRLNADLAAEQAADRSEE